MVGNQGHTYGLWLWVPYYRAGVFYDNSYAVRGHLTPALGIGFQAGGAPVDWEMMRRRIADWMQVADSFIGDFCLLAPYSLSESTRLPGSSSVPPGETVWCRRSGGHEATRDQDA